MKKVQARIGVLTPEQIEYIHSSTLKLLSITGIRVDSKRARKLFSEAIGKTAEDDRIRIPADLVERASGRVRHISIYSTGTDQKPSP